MTPVPTLRQSTLNLLDLVLTASGFPVVVVANPSLSTTAVLRMARGPQTSHQIEYNPDLAGEPDYYVAVQCGQILRFFSHAPGDRMDLGFAQRGLDRMGELVRTEVLGKAPGVTPEIAVGLAAQLYHGLMRQLRSVPVELRVEDWLRITHPEFAEPQRAAVLRQLDVNLASLSPSARAVAPTRVYKASVTINSATAQFWAGVYEMPDLAKPYNKAGFVTDGTRLLAAWRKVPSDATHDRDLIDAWADLLHLRGWYDWVPYDTPI